MSKRGADRERAGRKQFYLHEAYQGSRLQNNGRKRVHGTFPCERACVPLIQGSRGPAPPCGQQRRHSLSVRRDGACWKCPGRERGWMHIQTFSDICYIAASSVASSLTL